MSVLGFTWLCSRATWTAFLTGYLVFRQLGHHPAERPRSRMDRIDSGHESGLQDIRVMSTKWDYCILTNVFDIISTVIVLDLTARPV